VQLDSQPGTRSSYIRFHSLDGGGGIKGIAHRATDELGFHAVEHRQYVTDVHATVLHQLGLDPRRLEVPGQKRLETEIGESIKEIMV